jgi:chromatin structure-remodeling complex protein RSC7
MPDADVTRDSSGEEEDGGSLEPTADPLSEPETPIPQSTVPRKRRLGRPPKNKPLDWENPEEPAATDGASEVGTPAVRRRRGRPPASGSRFKPRGGPSHITQVPIDKEGNMMDVVDDEVALPEDPEGETKVDKMGRLQDGREYRCRTFTIFGRGERLYMLSTEPARCIGFRDSYLFFQKHKQLYKIIVDDHEKRDLIDRELIPHSYKGRAIGVVTARSVFREFGARIVVGGRKIIDDYQVAAARANGEIEGELADPNDKLPKPGESYNKNQYVAWHGASSVYHSGAPSVPMPNGKVVDAKKKKVTVTETNWMFEHAMEARYSPTLALFLAPLLYSHTHPSLRSSGINISCLAGSTHVYSHHVARLSKGSMTHTPTPYSIQALCSLRISAGSNCHPHLSPPVQTLRPIRTQPLQMRP